jgi:sodium/hydrogen antiporter
MRAFLSLAEIGLVLLLVHRCQPHGPQDPAQHPRAARAFVERRHAAHHPVRRAGRQAGVPALSIWEAGILAAILAPTDAGLGQIIVNSPLVPMRVRQALNVEAGLNDGLSVPFLLFFIAMAAAGEGGASFARFIGEQLGTRAGGRRGHRPDRRMVVGNRAAPEWMAESFLQLAVVSLPVFCLIFRTFGASPFIAAFAAGLFVQVTFKHAGKHSVEFTEEWGQILNLSVFFLFGMMVAPRFRFRIRAFRLYALLSLTVVRMLPVAVSLMGSGLDKRTIAFMGWFGPRGLASIVLGLVYLEQEKAPARRAGTRLAVMATVSSAFSPTA